MALTFNGSQYIYREEALNPPFTMACWFRSTNNTNLQTLMEISHSGGSNSGRYRIAIRGDQVGKGLIAQQVPGSFATTSTGYTVNTYHHACGVFPNTSGRTIYLDGGGENTDGTSGSPSVTQTIFGIGRNGDGNLNEGFIGDKGEYAIWTVALTAAEVQLLALGLDPRYVRPESLWRVWRAIEGDGRKDWVGSNNMLASPPYGTHPAIISPRLFVSMPAGTITVAPGRAYSLAATADGHNAIDLSWSAPSFTGGASLTSFSIGRRSPGGSGDWDILVADTASTATTYRDTTVDPETNYEYRIAANNAVGQGAWSVADDATTEAIPTVVSVIEPNADGSPLEWTVFIDDSPSPSTAHYLAILDASREPTAPGDTGDFLRTNYLPEDTPPIDVIDMTSVNTTDVRQVKLWVYGLQGNGYTTGQIELHIDGQWLAMKDLLGNSEWDPLTWTGNWTTADDIKIRLSSRFSGPGHAEGNYSVIAVYGEVTHVEADGPTYEELGADFVGSLGSDTTLARGRRVQASESVGSEMATDLSMVSVESLDIDMVGSVDSATVARRARNTGEMAAVIDGEVVASLTRTPEDFVIDLQAGINSGATLRTRRRHGPFATAMQGVLVSDVTMPTIKIIDPTGAGDFATLQAWINWAKVQASTDQWARVQGAGNIGPGDFSGWSVPPTHQSRIRVYTTPEWRHDGHYDPTKPRIDIAGDQHQRAILINTPYVSIQGLQIRATSGSPTGVRVQGVAGVVVDSNLIFCVGSTSWTYGIFARDSGTTAFQIRNNIVQCGTDSGAAIATFSDTGDTLSGQINNNTVIKAYRGVVINSY